MQQSTSRQEHPWPVKLTLMAVMMSRFCRLWLLEKEEFCSTIFSRSSMSSPWRPALMKLLTATLTCSGLRLSGRAVELTCTQRGD